MRYTSTSDMDADTSGEVLVSELQEIQVAQSQSFLVSGKFYFVEYTFHDSIF